MDLTLIIAIGSLFFSFVALSVMWLGKSKGNAVAFALSIVGIVSAIVALSLSSPRDLSGNCEVDYTGLLIGILGVLVTVLVGLQLYQALNLKEDAKKVEESNRKAEKAARKANKIEEQYNALLEKFNNLEQAFNELKGKISVIGEYVENPEWTWVVVDAEDKILFGIKHDGSIDWSVGVPGPIREELKKLENRIKKLEKEGE